MDCFGLKVSGQKYILEFWIKIIQKLPKKNYFTIVDKIHQIKDTNKNRVLYKLVNFTPEIAVETDS
jgi:hypothetical protein